MHNRRFTRPTNAFSKKFHSHVNMVALYTVWYNWIRVHLRTTPAIAANLTTTLMSLEDIVALPPKHLPLDSTISSSSAALRQRPTRKNQTETLPPRPHLTLGKALLIFG